MAINMKYHNKHEEEIPEQEAVQDRMSEKEAAKELGLATLNLKGEETCA